MSSNFVTEAIKHGNHIKSLEKTQNIILEHLDKYGIDIKNSEALRKLVDERSSEQQELRKEVINIMNKLGETKKTIRDDTAHEIDLKLLKKDLVNIMDNIQNLRSASKLKLSELRFQEVALEEELEIFNDKLGEWMVPVKIDFTQNVAKSTVKKRNLSISKETKNFMGFVRESGGHQNGWISSNHQYFLKIRKKHKDIDEIVKNVKIGLVDLSEEEIIKHNDWYSKYLELKESQKTSIQNWKKSKLKSDSTKPEATSNDSFTPIIKEKSRLKKEPTNKNSKSNNSIQEALLEWNLKKQEELERHNEIIKISKIRRQEIENERKKSQEERKKIVLEWRRLKEEEKKEKMLQTKTIHEKEKRLKAVEANKMIKVFQTQDDLYINKKKTKPVDKKIVRKTKSCQVTRDPKRLLQPTKTWMQRTIQKQKPEEKYKFNQIFSINYVPKLQVPAWRLTKSS